MIKESFLTLFRRKAKPDSIHFLNEIRSNLEHVFVMEQRQIITIRLDLKAAYPLGFDDYLRVVQEYNNAFDDHQACAQRYKAEPSRQTRDQALILDGKYEMLLEKFAALKPALSAAKEKANDHA